MLAKTIKVSELCSFLIHLAHEGGKIIKQTHESQDLKIKEKAINDPFTIADVTIQKYIISHLEKKWPTLKVVGEEDPAETQAIEVEDQLDAINLDLVSEGYLSSRSPGFENEIPIEGLTVWVDPVDATREFTKGMLHNCTTLIGVSRNAEPYLGVIHWPFSVNHTEYKPVTYFGVHGVGAAQFSDQPEGDPKEIEFASEASDGKTHMLMTGGQYRDEIDKWNSLPSVSITHQGGAGFKILQTALRRQAIYVHFTGATKKWDTSAGHAIVKSLGGEILSRKGEPLTYRLDELVNNDDGIVCFVDQLEYEKVKNRLSSIPRLH